jgi:hypothetical protein
MADVIVTKENAKHKRQSRQRIASSGRWVSNQTHPSSNGSIPTHQWIIVRNIYKGLTMKDCSIVNPKLYCDVFINKLLITDPGSRYITN